MPIIMMNGTDKVKIYSDDKSKLVARNAFILNCYINNNTNN